MKKAYPGLEQWQQEVLAVYDRVREHDEPYAVTDDQGIEIVVLPGVFSPRYFTDSFRFADVLPLLVTGKSMLEIGVGTGVVSLFAAKAGISMTGIDISETAVTNTLINFKKHNLEIDVRHGDMFDPLEEGEKYDGMFWNHPFNNWSKPVKDMLLRAGLDHRYEGLMRYIREGQQHLNNGGRHLLGTCNFADWVTILDIASQADLQTRLLWKVTVPMSPGSLYENDYVILEFVRQ